MGRFATPDAPKMDFVFTVCDNAANEVYPVWPGHPVTAHWGIPDPATVKRTDEESQKAFRDALLMLDQRITVFLDLPLSSIDSLALQKELDNIGRR